MTAQYIKGFESIGRGQGRGRGCLQNEGLTHDGVGRENERDFTVDGSRTLWA